MFIALPRFYSDHMDEQLLGCVYCNEPIRPKGFYCPKCGKQTRCKECNEFLEKDANACIYCGTEVSAKTSVTGAISQPIMNTVEYHETRSSRSFRATVTDHVGTSISGVLGAFVGKGFTPKPIKSKFEGGPLIEESAAEVLDDIEDSNEGPILSIQPESTTRPPVKNQSASPMLTQLLKIFRFDEDKTVLLEARLKAQNRLDYVRRLILLFLQANQLMGKSQVPRNEVVRLLERTKTGLNDGNTRRWISNNTALTIDEKAHTLEIITEGEELVKTYLQDIENPEAKDVWQITTAAKKKKKKKQDSDTSTE